MISSLTYVTGIHASLEADRGPAVAPALAKSRWTIYPWKEGRLRGPREAAVVPSR